MVSDTRDRSRDKATLPKQLSGRACQEARCCFWKTVFRGWASGFSAFHLKGRKVVASGSPPSLPFQKVLFLSERNTHRWISGFWHGTCFQRHCWRMLSSIKRKEGGQTGGRHSSVKAPVTIRVSHYLGSTRSFIQMTGMIHGVWLGGLTEGQCISRLFLLHFCFLSGCEPS